MISQLDRLCEDEVQSDFEINAANVEEVGAGDNWIDQIEGFYLQVSL